MVARKRRSGKRSGASSRRRRKAPSLIFFIDECLGGPLLADALRSAGARAELARSHFAAGARDVEWLPIVGARRWVVLTKDRHIRRRELEIDTLINAGVRAFVLTAADLTGPEQAAVFVKALPRIIRICQGSRKAVVAAVGYGGGVSLLAASAQTAAVRGRGRVTVRAVARTDWILLVG